VSEQAFLHLDLDSFFVSVERLRNKALIGKPVIVGGKSSRGVVAACSYEARRYGLHSAMPIVTARRLCPNGIYLSGDMDAYTHHSKVITEIIRERAPLFEKTSIDEFYLDLSGMDRFFGTVKWAWELRETIKTESGLPLSMGLSINKTVCKIATGEAKPDGKLHIAGEQVKPFLKPLDIRKMPMVGKVTHQFLLDMGINTIGKLMAFPPEVLQQTMGKNGLSLWNRANGIDPSPIVPYVESKSISTERTFVEDTTDMKYLHTILLSMTEKLGHELRADNRLTSCVAIKLRYADFDTQTCQIKIPYTNRDDVLIRTVMEVFKKCYSRRVLVRLVGVRFSDLVHGNYQLQLFDQNEKLAHLMLEMDRIKERYGQPAVSRVNGIYSTEPKKIPKKLLRKQKRDSKQASSAEN
jgi:DNA polymerase-4